MGLVFKDMGELRDQRMRRFMEKWRKLRHSGVVPPRTNNNVTNFCARFETMLACIISIVRLAVS